MQYPGHRVERGLLLSLVSLGLMCESLSLFLMVSLPPVSVNVASLLGDHSKGKLTCLLGDDCTVGNFEVNGF